MRLLVRAGKMPETVLSPEVSLGIRPWGIFGSNAGNLLFSEGVIRALSTPTTTILPDSFTLENSPNPKLMAQSVNDGFDKLILPLANAFRQEWIGKLRRLTKLIRNLKIPVVITGVGAQQPLDGTVGHSGMNEKLDTAVKSFVSAVLDHSAIIGVRGEFTAEYLKNLGFSSESIRIIGCPSLFMHGENLAIEKKPLTSSSPLAFSTARSVRGSGAFISKISQQYPQAHFIGQGIDELALLLWGQPFPKIKDKRLVSSPSHPLYQQNRVRFFIDPTTWIQYMKTRSFSIGTRIHGSIAAILAGTPAYVCCHDSRTLEIAKFHSLPHMKISSLAEVPAIERVYEQIDVSVVEAAHAANFANYKLFLESNGLEHVWMPEKNNVEYVSSLAAIPYPPPVEPLGFDNLSLFSRLQYLRGDSIMDAERASQFYEFPFNPQQPSEKV